MSRPLSAESVFRALAHASRRRLLELVSKREWAACDLAAEFEHGQPTISNHLRTLEQAGLIQHHRRGTNRIYRLTPGAMAPVQEWLMRLPASAAPRGRHTAKVAYD